MVVCSPGAADYIRSLPQPSGIIGQRNKNLTKSSLEKSSSWLQPDGNRRENEEAGPSILNSLREENTISKLQKNKKHFHLVDCL
jgi:hypothetical protein